MGGGEKKRIRGEGLWGGGGTKGREQNIRLLEFG